MYATTWCVQRQWNEPVRILTPTMCQCHRHFSTLSDLVLRNEPVDIEFEILMSPLHCHIGRSILTTPPKGKFSPTARLEEHDLLEARTCTMGSCVSCLFVARKPCNGLYPSGLGLVLTTTTATASCCLRNFKRVNSANAIQTTRKEPVLTLGWLAWADRSDHASFAPRRLRWRIFRVEVRDVNSSITILRSIHCYKTDHF